MPAAHFLDTSALTKRYVREIGSAWVIALINPAPGKECCLADITRVELVAALYFRARMGTLTLAQAQQAEQVFLGELVGSFRLLPLTDQVLNQAMRLVRTHPLRASDAVQLATALQFQADRVMFGGLTPVTFVSADRNLNRAAAAEGLLVDDPNSHP